MMISPIKNKFLKNTHIFLLQLLIKLHLTFAERLCPIGLARPLTSHFLGPEFNRERIIILLSIADLVLIYDFVKIGDCQLLEVQSVVFLMAVGLLAELATLPIDFFLDAVANELSGGSDWAVEVAGNFYHFGRLFVNLLIFPRNRL